MFRSSRIALFLCLFAGAHLPADPARADGEARQGEESLRAHRRCAEQFEAAQRQDMESFRDYDAERFRAIHHPDAVSIFASGLVSNGIDEIMANLAGHFANREALWTWTEVTRQVHGCKTAFILYDAVYEIPRIGFRQRTLTGVSYTYQHGKWLGILDQGTMLEPPN